MPVESRVETAADTVPPKRSSSRPSLISRASSFLANGTSRASSSTARKSRSSIFNFAPRPSAFEVDLVVAPGDLLETTAIVTVREDESMESLVRVELPTGTTLRILEVGSSDRRRVKVSMADCMGWISLKTRMNEPLVARTFVADDFEVGGTHEVKSAITLRAGESLDSPAILDLEAGTKVKVLELGAMSLRRARVAADHAEGWLSLCTKNGEYLLGKIEGTKYSVRPGTNITASMLEAARSGDLEGFMKAVDSPGGGGSRSSFLGKPAPARPDLNATDIRGKNALMFAASWGHERIVTYLLTQPEVDVFRADDTMKQVLHHAARMPRGAPSPAHAAIIDALIKAQANVEAADHRGATPLMIAAGVGHIIAAKALVAGSASIEAQDAEGETALDYARRGRQNELLELLTFYRDANAQADVSELSPTLKDAVDLELQADTGAQRADGEEVESPGSSPTARKKKVKKSVIRPKVEKVAAEVASPEKVDAEAASPTPAEDVAEGETPATTPGETATAATTPVSPGADEGEDEDDEIREAETEPSKAKGKPKAKKKAKSKVARKSVTKKPAVVGTDAPEDAAEEDIGEEEKVEEKLETKDGPPLPVPEAEPAGTQAESDEKLNGGEETVAEKEDAPLLASAA